MGKLAAVMFYKFQRAKEVSKEEYLQVTWLSFIVREHHSFWKVKVFQVLVSEEYEKSAVWLLQAV